MSELAYTAEQERMHDLIRREPWFALMVVEKYSRRHNTEVMLALNTLRHLVDRDRAAKGALF